MQRTQNTKATTKHNERRRWQTRHAEPPNTPPPAIRRLCLLFCTLIREAKNKSTTTDNASVTEMHTVSVTNRRRHHMTVRLANVCLCRHVNVRGCGINNRTVQLLLTALHYRIARTSRSGTECGGRTSAVRRQ